MANDIKLAITEGRTFLGIELGSTRIKAALIDEEYNPIASGGYDWANRLVDGFWTYSMDDVWKGLQTSFERLSANVREKYGVALETVGGMGISAMMHGYLPFGADGSQLAEFRTWRNTTTAQAAAELTAKFGFNVPQRWSVSHVYQAMLNGEGHVGDIALLTTLSGYVHWKLTGRRVLGAGDASGVFPLDSATNSYHSGMLDMFDEAAARFNPGWKLADILPASLSAGDDAGSLTDEGARLLDPSGNFKSGIPMCPPEGDAGTGMVATNSIAARTGNISAGTSVFAMIVLEKELSRLYEEIDMVTTPDGKPVAMVHCNNCTSDLDEWVRLFGEANELMGNKVDKPALYDALYFKALEGEPDCGGLVAYNYVSGEPITGFEQGRALFARETGSRFTLANFMRTILFGTMASLKIGMEIITVKENVRLDRLLGHGGLFKTKGVGQRFMAAALGVPVAVMESAGEGGAWGIALLAAYRATKRSGETLDMFLSERVFANNAGSQIDPDDGDARGFDVFIERYKAGFAIEKAAVESIK